MDRAGEGVLVLSGWQQVALVSVGGVLGVNARYWLGLAIASRAGTWMPWATGLINVTGAFALGLTLGAIERWRLGPAWSLVVGVGFLGGYTTFSTFAVETVRLANEAAFGRALAYSVGSVVLGVIAAAVGMALTRG